METGKTTKNRSRHFGANDRLEYRALYAVAFLPCLLAASYARLFPSSVNKVYQHSGSVITEARSAAHAAVGYAFMV